MCEQQQMMEEQEHQQMIADAITGAFARIIKWSEELSPSEQCEIMYAISEKAQKIAVANDKRFQEELS